MNKLDIIKGDFGGHVCVCDKCKNKYFKQSGCLMPKSYNNYNLMCFICEIRQAKFYVGCGELTYASN